MSLKVAVHAEPVGACTPKPIVSGLVATPGIANQRRKRQYLPSSEK